MSGAILDAFVNFRGEFLSLTRRAATHFARREWDLQAFDARQRLELHKSIVSRTVKRLETTLPDQGRHALWVEVKEQYRQRISVREDLELAETFFNSVTRRSFATVGVDAQIEFRWFGTTVLPRTESSNDALRTHTWSPNLEELVAEILENTPLSGQWRDLGLTSGLIATRLESQLRSAWGSTSFDGIDVLRPLFYRNKGAYLLGRIRYLNRVTPFILAIVAHPDGTFDVDAALFDESEASRLFSFTRSYFHVEWDNPSELIGLLKSILPMKPIAELYTAIGYNQHGKTALYRALYRHLEHSTGQFRFARGTPGMVMTVFTLPSFDVVFKIIKDRFAPPKKTTRSEVMERYRLVFQHDRVGRMVDAQEFENLSFSRDRFSPELLEELSEQCAATVTIDEDEVVIGHVYTERRVYPLDLYVREIGHSRAEAAALEYGEAIKDLAAANIFPGDLFTKNFGVTRHGVVVFYDYDELQLLSDCNFRELPAAQHEEDEMRSEAWFSVDQLDVFPEEFATFMWFPGSIRETVATTHAELFDVNYWRELQQQHGRGELPDFFPYPSRSRLRSHPV